MIDDVLSAHPWLTFQRGVDPGRAWQLHVYVNDDKVLDTVLLGTTPPRRWKTLRLDLSNYATERRPAPVPESPASPPRSWQRLLAQASWE